MAYLAPFILGIITASLVQWQWGRRKQQQPTKATHTDAVPVVTGGEPPTQPPPAQQPPTAALDDLTIIRGVGPVYAKRLQAAGIVTFAQLADLTPEQIAKIVVQGNIDRVINTQDWIMQAQKLANPPES